MKTIERNTLMTIDHNVNSTKSKQTEHHKNVMTVMAFHRHSVVFDVYVTQRILKYFQSNKFLWSSID